MTPRFLVLLSRVVLLVVAACALLGGVPAHLRTAFAASQEPAGPAEAPLASGVATEPQPSQETGSPTNPLPAPSREQRSNQVQEASSVEPGEQSGDREDPTALTPALQEALQLTPGGVESLPLPPLPSVRLRGRVIGLEGGGTALVEIDGELTRLSVSAERNRGAATLLESYPLEGGSLESELELALGSLLGMTEDERAVRTRDGAEHWELIQVSPRYVVLLAQPWNRLVIVR
ncbi:MAG: hypothetical protein R3B96_09230 [Pirellulaceae bacterium]